MAPERIPAIKVMLLPKDTNALGTIFGGVILSHIDLASAVEARKAAPHRYVTKAMREVEFHAAGVPRRHRELLHRDRAHRPHLDHGARCSVEAERWGGGSGEQVKVTEAEVVLVAVDERGRADVPVLGEKRRRRREHRVTPRPPTLKVVCPHDCPDTCVMTVDVEDGRAVAIGGDPDHRFTQGFLCAKVNQYLDRVYSPDRLLHPLRRVGHEGRGPVRAHLLGRGARPIAATLLRAIADEHGPQAILPVLLRRQHGPARPTAAWTAASSTRSGRACSTAPSARAPGGAGYKATVRQDASASTPRPSSTRG